MYKPQSTQKSFCGTPPPTGVFRRALSSLVIFVVRLYRVAVSPMFPPSCRYTPSCSQYTIDAFNKNNPLKASLLSLKRLLSCHPWSKGGYDPA
ncbi:MAG: membrane protein insertion efficiency factor YidD [Candidatus Marinimicrobia bacterium]|nr:membrane protein insertion efficiency factor YidD [Candidatus Neomarinimicrobiota bacterium]